jgi:hypothetical protein
MFGMTEQHIDRMLDAVRRVYDDQDLHVMGWWCVLPLSCGVGYGRTFHGAANTFEALDVKDSVIANLGGEILPEDLASHLCGFIVELLNDPVHHKMADNRLSQSSLGKLPVEKRRPLIPYFTLCILLNNLSNGEIEPITMARAWVGGSDRKWVELFFGTGVLFGVDDRSLSDSVCNGLLSIFPPPRSTVIQETVRFFGSRESE